MKTSTRRIIDPVSPRQQRNWDWRAAANFICGGAGGGLLACSALVDAGPLATRMAIVFGLLLIGAGLTCVWFEIGRPRRALNVFRHVKTSWMTREAFVALAIFPLGALAVLTLSPPLQGLLGLLGLLFVYCQARILSTNKGIPVWRQPRSVALLMATGLTEGAAALLVVLVLTGSAAVVAMTGALLMLIALRWLLWRAYFNALRRDGAPLGSLKAFEAMGPRFMAMGHAVPAFFVIAAFSGLQGAPLWALLAGLLAAAGGWYFKFTLILRAAFTQGLALKHLPVRGAGPAGAAVKPGWHTPA